MRSDPRCIHCRRRRGNLVQLPLTGEWRVLCDRCRGPVFLSVMQALAHG